MAEAFSLPTAQSTVRNLLQMVSGFLDIQDPAPSAFLVKVPRRFLEYWVAQLSLALRLQEEASLSPAPHPLVAAVAAWRLPYAGLGLTDAEIDARVQAMAIHDAEEADFQSHVDASQGGEVFNA